MYVQERLTNSTKQKDPKRSKAPIHTVATLQNPPHKQTNKQTSSSTEYKNQNKMSSSSSSAALSSSTSTNTTNKHEELVMKVPTPVFFLPLLFGFIF